MAMFGMVFRRGRWGKQVREDIHMERNRVFCREYFF
jgi:hypothetical protein